MTAAHFHRPFFRLAALALLASARVHAEPFAELAAFSTLKDVTLETLAKSPVKTGRGPALSSARGLAVESCYLVRKPLAKTVELHQQWSPTRHSELKVWLHGDLSAHPAPAEFAKIASAPGNGSVKAFVSATQKLATSGAGLQMSAAEAKAFSGSDAGGAMTPGLAGLWGNLLHQRAQAYLSGGLGRLPAYETGGETVRAADEVARLLKDAPKWSSQFSALIGPGGGKGSASPYWELFDVEGEAALSLGASYSKHGADTAQAVDVQYYSSGGYYVLLTFYQMWPVKIAGQDATLVWRGDLISAASLATLHGVERMGSSTAMMQETKKTIGCLLRDAGGTN